jgi:hypothetical protein
MAVDINDIFNDAAPVAASNTQIQEIGILAKQAIALMEEIAAIEEQLKARKKDLDRIVAQDLPEAMDAANSASFTDKSTGKKITIKDDVSASISKNHAPEAHKWLRDNGHEELIKNQIVVPLGKGLDNVASGIITMLKAQFDVEAERKESVHAQTLGAFVREQMAAGVELPHTLLGIYTRRVAVIK